MGFGFNIFVFPLLLLTSLGLVIYNIAIGGRKALKLLGGMWAVIILLMIYVSVKSHYESPIRLTKGDIIGVYRIDTAFYPGPNARWQYAHYRFMITEQDSIAFEVINDQETRRHVYTYKIKYSAGPPALWTIESDTTFHIIRRPPVLYRSHDRFYYVFHSDKFSNVFFRKAGS